MPYRDILVLGTRFVSQTSALDTRGLKIKNLNIHIIRLVHRKSISKKVLFAWNDSIECSLLSTIAYISSKFSFPPFFLDFVRYFVQMPLQNEMFSHSTVFITIFVDNLIKYITVSRRFNRTNMNKNNRHLIKNKFS